MSWVESGGGGVTTGGDYTLGDVTADALILDQANADLVLERDGLNGVLKVVTSVGGSTYDGVAASYLWSMNGGTRAAQFANNTLALNSGGSIVWADTANSTSTKDVGLARNAAGVLEVTDGSTGNGTLITAGGAAGAPAYSFANDPDTGIYNTASDQIGFATQGTQRWNMTGGSFIGYNSGAKLALLSTDGFSTVGLVMGSEGEVSWCSTTAYSGTRDTKLERESAGVLKVAQENGAGWHIATASEELTALSGVSASTTNLVPAGGRIINVVVRVTTTITGATSFSIGDGSDVDRYGATIALTAGTTTDHSDATADPMSWSASAQDVTLTANGSNFTAGAVRVVATYLAAEPPGS